jgi:flap endonuclease-1
MGIAGLWAYVNKKHADLFRYADVTRCSGQTWGIDTSIYMHRFGYDSPGVPPVDKFLEQAEELRAAGVVPVYIFDGKRDPVKRHEHARRKVQTAKLEDASRKRAAFVMAMDEDGAPPEVDPATAPPDVRRLIERKPDTLVVEGLGEIEIEVDVAAEVARIRERHEKEKERGGARLSFPDSHYHALMEAFDAHSIGYYIAATDAEHLGSQLTRSGKLDVLVTDDGDALAFGATAVVRNLFQPGKNGMQRIVPGELWAALGLTREQFSDVAIVCGCDYTESKGLPSIGPDRAVKLIKTHGTIDAYLRSKEWPKKRAQIEAKYPDFKLEQFQHEIARQVFSDDEPRIVYTSRALDPDAEPLMAAFAREDAAAQDSKRARLADPVF